MYLLLFDRPGGEPTDIIRVENRDRFAWRGDAPPSIPFERMVIYETHLKGFTAHPSSKVTHPGTYLGFVEKIPHLQSLGGDEFLRTQGGNNNAYCQDNPISWLDWGEVERNVDMVDFFRKAIAFTKRYTILQRRKFFTGTDTDEDANAVPDIQWFGEDLGPPRWDDPEARVLCCLLDGNEESSEAGSYFLFLALNGDHRPHEVMVPPLQGIRWRRAVDTSLPAGEDFTDDGSEPLQDPADRYLVNPRTTVVLVGK